MLTKHFFHQLRFGEQLHGFTKRVRQRLKPSCTQLLTRKPTSEVFFHRRAQLEFFFYALQASSKHRRKCQVRVSGRIGASQLYAARLFLIGFVTRNAHQRRTIIARPRDLHRCFTAGNQTFIRINAGVGEQAEFGNVLEQARNIVLCHLRKVVSIRIAGIEERIVAFFIK